jgi:hypothetical protein
MTVKERYEAAHHANFQRVYPLAYKDGHYCKPKYPRIATANGLTTFIVNYINWSGYIATRVNSMGRLIDGTERTASGVLLSKKKWIPGTTAKGTADIMATIAGKSVSIEIKVGSDRPRPEQLEMQNKVRNAGGIYEFISNPEEFFVLYDTITR